MRNKIVLVAVLLTALIAGSCKKELKDFHTYQPLGNTKLDSVRLYNLLPDSSGGYPGFGYVLYVNDSAVVYKGKGLSNTVTYGTPAAILLPTQGGTFDVKLMKYVNDSLPPAHPRPSLVVCEKTITVSANSGYGSMFFYDSAGTATAMYLPQTTSDPGAPGFGHYKLRVINFGYDWQNQPYYGPYANSAGTKFDMQLRYPDSTIVKGQDLVHFGTVSSYVEFPYETAQYIVYNLTQQMNDPYTAHLDQAFGAYGLYQDLSINYTNNYGNFVLPNPGTIFGAYLYPPDVSTVEQTTNISSYPFAAGGCYSVLVIGNIYTVILDRQYGIGTADNIGKIQLVNTDPSQPNIQVSISGADGHSRSATLSFGQADTPFAVPAGPVTCTFSAKGQTLYTYQTSVIRLANQALYFMEDLNHIPFVFATNVAVDGTDYIPPVPYGGPRGQQQLATVNTLNLVPDAGNVFFTAVQSTTGTFETNISGDVPYEGAGGTAAHWDGTIPATYFALHLTTQRPDSLSGAKVADWNTPFPKTPTPGTFTLIAAGRLNATDASQKPRLFLVRHSNFIYKAQ